MSDFLDGMRSAMEKQAAPYNIGWKHLLGLEPASGAINKLRFMLTPNLRGFAGGAAGGTVGTAVGAGIGKLMKGEPAALAADIGRQLGSVAGGAIGQNMAYKKLLAEVEKEIMKRRLLLAGTGVGGLGLLGGGAAALAGGGD